MPQPLGNLAPFTAFLPFKLLSHSTTSTTITTPTANRWTLFAIGGTAIAVVAFGGSAPIWPECVYSGSSSYSREDLRSLPKRRSTPSSNLISETQTDPNMFSIFSYLVEKISSLIPWRSAASALNNTGGNRRQEIEGTELGERAGTGKEAADEDEVKRLKKLLEEVSASGEESSKALEEVKTLRGEVERLKRELERMKSEARKGEADVGRVDPYSVTQDGASEAEVISLLEALNTEIMEVAQAVVRAFANSSRPVPQLPSEELSEELKEAVIGATEILGLGMVELLQVPQHQGLSGDEDTVRMALKASMAAYVHWIISSWYFENPEDEHLLSEIYARVRETEDQTVSGRWRALTRVHLQRMLAEEPDLTIYMVDAFVNIILTAGWHNNAAALQEYLIETFGHMTGSVLEKAKKLNKVIGEEIVKSDLEALYIAPDVIFNEMTMEAAGHEGDQVEGLSEKRVLCTTKLGLVKAEKRSGKVGEWEEAVLLKPSVVLQSSMVVDSE